jgi:hypothetical protein
LLRRKSTLNNIPKRWINSILAYVTAPVILSIGIPFSQVIAILNPRQVVSWARESVGFEICKRRRNGRLGCVNIFEFVVRIGLRLIVVDIQFVVKVIPMSVVIAAEFLYFLKGLGLHSVHFQKIFHVFEWMR